MTTAVPSRRQLEFQDWEFGVFIHFLLGIFRGTAYRAERDTVSPALFNPTQLDCRQWARTAAQAGARYMVFTTKHHDGFCLWPSKHTPDFSVAATQWRDGSGDVVKEFTDACRAEGLKIGLYYSPFDKHCPFYATDAKKYDEYFLGHLRELLGGTYGQIDIMWFDGAFSEGHVFDWPRIVREIRSMQKDILIFGEGDPDYRWIGNEAGIAPILHRNTVDGGNPVTGMGAAKGGSGTRWLPAECDARIRFKGWSWRGLGDPLKSVEELMGLYHYSVGRGCNFLLNVGPDQRGLMHEEDAGRLLEFGAEVKRRFGTPLATLRDCVAAGSTWTWKPAEPVVVDHAVIMEDLSVGEHIERFVLKCKTAPADFSIGPVTLYEGRTIGHKVICRFPPAKIDQLTLEIVESDGTARIRSLEFFNVCGA